MKNNNMLFADRSSCGWNRYASPQQRIHQYLYENVDSDFQALLNVDDNALVIDYEDRWKRIFPVP